MKLKPRDTQTQVKHMILSKYLDTWGGIILNGLKRWTSKYKKIEHNFVYVDCFSYLGIYAGDASDLFQYQDNNKVVGSPVIGIRALDELKIMARRYNIDLQVNTILIEKDKQIYQGLLETLAAEGFNNRIRKTEDFSTLAPDEIAVVNNDAIKLTDKLLNYTGREYTKAFYLIDPYGAGGIPHEFVQTIVSGQGHDVMINFLYHDLHLKSGGIETPKQRKHVGHWTNAFGNKEWIEIVRNIEENRYDLKSLIEVLGLRQDDPLFRELRQEKKITRTTVSKLIERQLVDLYYKTLTNMDSELAVKSVRLLFPDKERTMFYLFLTTHDPTGALALNKILSEAKLREYELRDQRRIAKKHPGQLSMFETSDHLVENKDDRPTVEECAENIRNKFSGLTIKRREVFQELVEEDYFPEEVDKAIKYLKRKGKVTFKGTLNHETRIEFANN